MRSLPVLAYHSVAPGETIGPELLARHLDVVARCGLPSLGAEELDSAPKGVLLTFDDGFADLWTHALPLLEERRLRAVVFAIPSRTGDGPVRPQGRPASGIPSWQAHAEAVASGFAHPAFLRWSELAALEATGLVTAQSHSWSHAMGWVSGEIVGFHLGRFGRTHWSLPQCTGGDTRLGIPLYARGSALAHRLYFDDPALRDHLAQWLDARGGETYVASRSPGAAERELRAEAAAFRRRHGDRGRREEESQRPRRVLENLARAREALERRLGGRRDELCAPWGEYDDVLLDAARRTGIRRIYTLERGPNPARGMGVLVGRFEARRRGPLWLRWRLWLHRTTAGPRLHALLSRRGRHRSGWR